MCRYSDHIAIISSIHPNSDEGQAANSNQNNNWFNWDDRDTRIEIPDTRIEPPTKNKNTKDKDKDTKEVSEEFSIQILFE